jgi:hypothetical protein
MLNRHKAISTIHNTYVLLSNGSPIAHDRFLILQGVSPEVGGEALLHF